MGMVGSAGDWQAQATFQLQLMVAMEECQPGLLGLLSMTRELGMRILLSLSGL